VPCTHRKRGLEWLILLGATYLVILVLRTRSLLRRLLAIGLGKPEGNMSEDFEDEDWEDEYDG